MQAAAAAAAAVATTAPADAAATTATAAAVGGRSLGSHYEQQSQIAMKTNSGFNTWPIRGQYVANTYNKCLKSQPASPPLYLLPAGRRDIQLPPQALVQNVSLDAWHVSVSVYVYVCIRTHVYKI